VIRTFTEPSIESHPEVGGGSIGVLSVLIGHADSVDRRSFAKDVA